MKLATTLTLAIATFGLGLYVYLDQTGAIENLFGEKPAPLFEGPAVAAVTSLTIADPSETRTLEKREGRWMLASPVNDLVDPDWIEGVMETFGRMHPKEFLRDDSGSQREGYGLSPDRSLALTVGFAQGEPLVYQIGDPGPFEKSAYLFPGNAESYEGAFVVAGDFRKIVETPVVEMVDPTLARFAADRVVLLTLKRRREVISLKRRDAPGSRWRLEAPDQFQADDDMVNGLLSGLSTIVSANASVPPEDEANPATPTLAVEIGDVDPTSTFELSFYPHPSDDTLLQARHSKRPLLYEIPKSALKDIPSDAKLLRESRLLRVLAADISKVTLSGRGVATPLTLENQGAWLMSTPEGAKMVNQEEGERFLKLFNETEIDLYLEGGADKDALYGLDDPFFTVQFEGENLGPLQGESCLLRIAMPKSSPQAYVSVEGMDTIAAVNPTFLTGIAQLSKPLRWKKLEVLNVAFDRIREVTLAETGKEALRVDVDFKADKPEDRLRIFRQGQDRTADVDLQMAAALIYNLGNLSPNSWISKAPANDNALATPSLVVTVKSEPEEKGGEEHTAILRLAPISPNASDFYYGVRDGREDEPFLIKGDAYKRLSGAELLIE